MGFPMGFPWFSYETWGGFPPKNFANELWDFGNDAGGHGKMVFFAIIAWRVVSNPGGS